MLPKDVYNLNLYERNVQVVGLRSIDAPVLMDTIRTALPEGVTMSMHEHTRDMEEERWISDPFIDSLRTELESRAEEKAAEKMKSEAKLEATYCQNTNSTLLDRGDKRKSNFNVKLDKRFNR